MPIGIRYGRERTLNHKVNNSCGSLDWLNLGEDLHAVPDGDGEWVIDTETGETITHDEQFEATLERDTGAGAIDVFELVSEHGTEFVGRRSYSFVAALYCDDCASALGGELPIDECPVCGHTAADVEALEPVE